MIDRAIGHDILCVMLESLYIVDGRMVVARNIGIQTFSSGHIPPGHVPGHFPRPGHFPASDDKK